MPESNSFSKDSTLQIAVLQSYSLDIQSDRCNYLAINDGGSMIDIIPYQMAMKLVQKGVIKGIETNSEPFRVNFGKLGTFAMINQYVLGKGLLDKVSVSEDISVALISDVTLTSKDLTIVKRSHDVWGITSYGTVVFHGVRSSSSPRTLWQLDIEALLQAPDPRLCDNNDDFAILSSTTSKRLPTSVLDSLYSVLSNISGSFTGFRPTFEVYSARVEFSKSQIKEGRRVQRSVAQLESLSKSIEVGAIRNVSPKLSSGLLLKISDLNDNIPYLISHRRKFTGGGSGVFTNIPGAEFSFDDQGKYAPSIFAITGEVVITDKATGAILNYGINSKKAIKDAIAIYCQFIYSHGLQVIRAQCDSTSMEKSTEFKSVCAFYKISVVPAPPEQQNKNPVERSWQIIQKDAACDMISQKKSQ